MKLSKETLTELALKAQRAANRVEAATTRRKNVAFADRRTKRNRTRGAKNRKAMGDQG